MHLISKNNINMSKFVYLIYKEIGLSYDNLSITNLPAKIGYGGENRLKSYVTPYTSTVSVYKSPYMTKEIAKKVETCVLSEVETIKHKTDRYSEVCKIGFRCGESIDEVIYRYKSTIYRIMNLIDKYSEMYNPIEKPIEIIPEQKPVSNNIISVLSNVHKDKITRKKQKNNTSGTIGVSYESNKNRWKAYITKDGISQYKCFDNQADAIKWRKKQERI